MTEQSESFTVSELIGEALKLTTELYDKYQDRVAVEVLLYLALRLIRGAIDTWITLKVLERRENHGRAEN